MQLAKAMAILIVAELERSARKWWRTVHGANSRLYRGSVAAPDGFLYGIPHDAQRVVKFSPVDKSITCVRPDFGEDPCEQE